MSSAPSYIANFDSASAMLRATARFLHGQDFPALGLGAAMKPLARVVNFLPETLRETIYALGGGNEAIRPRRIDTVDAEELATWAVNQYPEREYPAVMIGSSNGAAVHLCAALGIPWLPQTTLIPVQRSGIHPDEMIDDMDWGREPGRRLLEANPELQLHHMHDPNQDRLMIQYMTYFRVKRLTLGRAYKRFIERVLPPDGTIFLLECTRTWPVKQLGERHYFQPGALGGLETEDYFQGSPQVADFLQRYDSHRRQWEPPAPDAEQPEAEWGFEPALRDDVLRFADEKQYRVRRITFAMPEALSPLVADLYRWWYRQRRIIANRLLGESFIAMEPWWALRTGAVPFWTKFAVTSSAANLEEYLQTRPLFDDIYMMLFSHGTESAGLASIERWQSLLAHARREGRFIGVDEMKYPKDFATFGRYHEDVQTIPARYPMPGWLSLDQLDAFLEENTDRYDVTWTLAREPVTA